MCSSRLGAGWSSLQAKALAQNGAGVLYVAFCEDISLHLSITVLLGSDRVGSLQEKICGLGHHTFREQLVFAPGELAREVKSGPIVGRGIIVS